MRGYHLVPACFCAKYQARIDAMTDFSDDINLQSLIDHNPICALPILRVIAQCQVIGVG
jgi:hypothetical protein